MRIEAPLRIFHNENPDLVGSNEAVSRRGRDQPRWVYRLKAAGQVAVNLMVCG
jgi:hypothetical protein